LLEWLQARVSYGLPALAAAVLFQASHFAGLQAVHRFDDGQLALVQLVLEHSTVGQDVVGTLSDILPHCRVNQFVALGMLFRANHGGINMIHNGLQVRRGHLFAGASRLHRAAAGMSHNHEHAAGQVLDGVVDASKTNRISNVARRAHHK
jgi:hypothetical protein